MKNWASESASGADWCPSYGRFTQIADKQSMVLLTLNCPPRTAHIAMQHSVR
jgi:hypothetical protein